MTENTTLNVGGTLSTTDNTTLNSCLVSGLPGNDRFSNCSISRRIGQTFLTNEQMECCYIFSLRENNK